MPFPEDWRTFIESLNSNEIEYVIVGAVALAYHGFPRYTGDLAVLVRNTPENTKPTGVRAGSLWICFSRFDPQLSPILTA
jgi:hypothetical protein